jgi:hypothetical protein
MTAERKIAFRIFDIISDTPGRSFEASPRTS